MTSAKDTIQIYDKFTKRMGLPIINIIFEIDLLYYEQLCKRAPDQQDEIQIQH